MDLGEMWEEARSSGWASGQLARAHLVDFIPHYAEQLGWAAVSTRTGEGPVSVLRPVDQTEARAETMSAVYGLDAQPLHVDGSHLVRPPDVIILFSEEPNSTPTRFWKPEWGGWNPDAARHGIFTVGTGRSTFLAPAVDRDGWRYDPVIMKPADGRARNIADFFNSESYLQAEEVPWDGENCVLVVANRQVLHGRAAVAEGDGERQLVRMAFNVRSAE